MAFEATSVEGHHQWHRCKKCSILFYWRTKGIHSRREGAPPAEPTSALTGDTFFPSPRPAQTANRIGGFAPTATACSGTARRQRESARGPAAADPPTRGSGRRWKSVRPVHRPRANRLPWQGRNTQRRVRFDATMYAFAGFPEPQYSHRNRGGEPLGGQYLFSKLHPSVPVDTSSSSGSARSWAGAPWMLHAPP